ncbi:MAG: ABC transporter ATP-binding protein, partial [Thermodesulfobacteriota bacterium]
VKHFSSGMNVRLAFAVAAHLDPEIMLMDEVLAVGDNAFKEKCLKKMKEVASQGRTVLFVSHDMKSIEEFCDRAIFLRQGKIVIDGEIDKVISYYLDKKNE